MSLLGSTVKDKVTGFTGIVVGTAEYLYANPRVQVQPACTDPANGALPKEEWFDEGRIEVITQVHVAGFRLPPKST